MIQATTELILGIELNKNFAQITYFHQSVKEPVTLGMAGSGDQMMIPPALRQNAKGQWMIWNGEPVKDEEEPDLFRISDLFGKLERQEVLGDGERSFEPAELLTIYFKVCMSGLKLLTHNTKVHVMVTVKELTERWSSLIVEALERNNIDRKQIYLQDYLSSFYYYTVNQKKELWYQDVALLDYEEESIVGYVLHIDRSTRPAIARAQEVARQPMGDAVRDGRSDQEWKKEKDRLFFELLKKVFERRTISVSYLIGDYFNKSWAERSIQYLCYKRHAFQGKNLYSKGACYAAMERAGLIPGRDILFGGRDMIQRNIGMEMRIRGKDTFYPMISAGINWYEAHHVCEFILNHEREIRIISSPMEPGESIIHGMRLPGLPPRPNRSTRIRLTLYFSSPTTCVVETEDLGFGGFYRSSGLSWSRTIKF